MKFTIERTSDYEGIRKPSKNAVLSKDKSSFDISVWEIEIESLEELLKLKEEVNYPIILRDSYDVKGMLTLEIYDDYRE